MDPLQQMLIDEGNADEAELLDQQYFSGTHVTHPEHERELGAYEPEPEYDLYHTTNLVDPTE